MDRRCNLDEKKSQVVYLPQSNIMNKLFLKVLHARRQKGLFVYYAVLALILVFFQLFFTTSASAFQIGDRVQATDNLNVRNCPFLACDVIGVIANGGAGRIINGPYSGDGYTWWYIGWDNGLTGYSVQNWLTVIPGTLPASFTLNQPSTSCSSTNPQISLSWGSSSGATKYDVYRNGAFYANAYTSLTYNNTSVISGTTYTYFICASNSAGYCDSNTVTATAPNCVASPQITIGPSSLNFDSVQAGSCSSAQFAVQHVLNTGTASGTVTISQNPPFRVTSNGSFSLSNGQAVNVNVEFCPTSSGSFSGTALISSNATQNINSVSLSGTGSTPSPTTGAIQVNSKLDGTSWSGSVNYSVSGAQNFSGNSVPADFQSRPQGNYTLAYVSGGPANSTFASITPSSSLTLNGGGMITFTLNFKKQTSNQPPVAKFTMTSGDKSVDEGQNLNLTVSSGGTAQVIFSGSRSSDPDGSISSYRWKINGTQVSASRDFSYALGKGTYQIYLTVTDNQGAEGSIGGTVTVTEQASNQSPVAKFTMTSGDKSVDEGQNLNLTVSSGGTAQVIFSGSRSSDPDGSISSYRWKINGTQVSASRDFSYALGKGTYQIYLTVTDNQGAEGSTGGTVTVTEQASNQSPVAKFTMTSGDKSVDEGQNLNLTVSSGGTAQVIFSGSRSSDPDGSISSYRWKINGTQVSASRDFSYALGKGTYQIYLTVTDNQGAEGSIGGTVTVTEQTCPPSTVTTLKWPLNGSLSDRAITSGFGDDWNNEYCEGLIKKHTGFDVSADKDENVYAAKSGVVKVAQTDPKWGGWVTIEHPDSTPVFTTVYWHVNPLDSLSVGESVNSGQRIATIADLGSKTHFHFGVRFNSYDNISNRGGLPQTDCEEDPAFPECFIDPETISFESDPAPDIKANNSDGPITISFGTPVSITVSLKPGNLSGQNADWWVAAAYRPFGAAEEWYWYTYVHPTGWLSGINVCVQGPLSELSPPVGVLNAPLPVGDYNFYFTLDHPDRAATGPWWGLDSVYVTVINENSGYFFGDVAIFISSDNEKYLDVFVSIYYPELSRNEPFGCVDYEGVEAVRQCKALVNFYVSFILDRGLYLALDSEIINNGLQLSNGDVGYKVIKREDNLSTIQDLIAHGVNKEDVFFVKMGEDWGHYGIIYDVDANANKIYVLDANANKDGKIQIHELSPNWVPNMDVNRF